MIDVLFTHKDSNETVCVVKFIEWDVLARLILSLVLFFVILTVGISSVAYLLENSLGIGKPDWLGLAYAYGTYLLVLLTFFVFLSFVAKHERLVIDRKNGLLKGDKLSIPLHVIKDIHIDSHWTKTRITKGILVLLSDGKKLTLLFYPEYVRNVADKTDEGLCDVLRAEILGLHKGLHVSEVVPKESTQPPNQ